MATFYSAPGQGTLERSYYEEQPGAAYQRFLTDIGMGDLLSPESQYLGGLASREYTRYLSQVPQHGLDWSYVDYLAQRSQSGDLQREYGQLSPQQRGEQPGVYAPRLRWFL